MNLFFTHSHTSSIGGWSEARKQQPVTSPCPAGIFLAGKIILVSKCHHPPILESLVKDAGAYWHWGFGACPKNPTGSSASRAVSQRTCLTFSPRSGRSRDDTKVDAVCSYKENASLASFDREKLYQELSSMTNNVTQLGHYSLDRSSLYINGKHPWDNRIWAFPGDHSSSLGLEYWFVCWVFLNLTQWQNQSYRMLPSISIP